VLQCVAVCCRVSSSATPNHKSVYDDLIQRVALSLLQVDLEKRKALAELMEKEKRCKLQLQEAASKKMAMTPASESRFYVCVYTYSFFVYTYMCVCACLSS